MNPGHFTEQMNERTFCWHQDQKKFTNDQRTKLVHVHQLHGLYMMRTELMSYG